jgi:hypothetical protein
MGTGIWIRWNVLTNYSGCVTLAYINNTGLVEQYKTVHIY